MTPMPTITFNPYDHVRIEAEGCVRIGDFSDSSKLYVNPDYAYTDTSGAPSVVQAGMIPYQGLIWIPGATAGLVPIFDVAGQTLIVKPAVPKRVSSLVLGYVDDNYSDNGYGNQNNGTQDQCREQPDAYVSIWVTPGTSSDTSQTAGQLDLTWDNVDLNGFPINARLVAQGGSDPTSMLDPYAPCSSANNWTNPTYGSGCRHQFYSFDQGDVGCRDFPTHWNYGVTTYEGRLHADAQMHDPGITGDDDYNMFLQPGDSNNPLYGGTNYSGVTNRSTNGTIRLEFDSEETVDEFHSSWWTDFHDAVDSTQGAIVPQILAAQAAIVVGMYNWDMENAGAESHPVYALAIDTQNTDTNWAIFVRNWGNEGGCGADPGWPLALQRGDLNLWLPWKAGATGVTLDPSTEFTAEFHDRNSDLSCPPVQGPYMYPYPNKGGVLLRFALPDPGCRGEMDGLLKLLWTF